MRILVMITVTVVSVITWKMASSDMGAVINCMAREFLGGPRTSWQCNVVCDPIPDALQGIGKIKFT